MLAPNLCASISNGDGFDYDDDYWVGAKVCSSWDVDAGTCSSGDTELANAASHYRWMYDNSDVCTETYEHDKDADDRCWKSGEPGSTSEYCLEMNNDEEYNNEDCNNENRYVCAKCSEGVASSAVCAEGTQYLKRYGAGCWRCESCQAANGVGTAQFCGPGYYQTAECIRGSGSQANMVPGVGPRQCEAIGVCSSDQWDANGQTPTAGNTDCRTISPCPAGQGQTTAPTATSDRECDQCMKDTWR